MIHVARMSDVLMIENMGKKEFEQIKIKITE